MTALSVQFMRVLLRAGGGEADQEEGGVKTSLIVSTLPSPRPDGERRIGLLTEELSKTQRADEHPPPDDDDESALVLVVFEALGLHQLVASLRENKLQVIKKQM